MMHITYIEVMKTAAAAAAAVIPIYIYKHII